MARPICNWDEEDAFTGWRHFLKWQRGERQRIKRMANRRDRRKTREMLRNYEPDEGLLVEGSPELG